MSNDPIQSAFWDLLSLTHFARVVCLLPVSAILALFVAAPVAAQEPKPLKWAADKEGGLPYIAIGKDGEITGFEVDIARALEKELKRPIEFVQYDFKNLIEGLKKGDFDFAMNGLEITPLYKNEVRYSKPYYVYRQQLVVRKDEERLHTFKDCTQLKGIVVGTLDSTAAERLLNQFKIEKKLYDGQREAYVDLGTAGRIDAVLMDLPIALTYARDDPKLKFTGQPFARGYYAIAFRTEDRRLADEVDAALDRLKQNGSLRDIYVRWGLWDEIQEELMPGFLFEEDAKTGHSTGQVEEASIRFSPSFYLPLLGQYALITVVLTGVSFALAVLLGLPLALTRLYGPWWLRGLAIGYIEFFRGVPVMLLLFFLYFGLPAIAEYYGLSFSLGLSSFWAAALGLGLNYAAYEAEIYRASVQAIPTGQWEAAASLGMSAPLTFRRIILPQALRSILPPTTGDLVALFKDTSIASAIGLVELNKEYLILSKSSLQYVEIGLATAALYLVMSIPLGHLSRWLERRWSEYAV